MVKKFSNEQMRDIHNEYYSEKGLVRVDEATGRLKKDSLRAIRSSVTKEIVDENRYFFDLLELDEQDCIRFNFTRYKDCSCRYFLWDRNDLVRLRDFLDRYLRE